MHFSRTRIDVFSIKITIPFDLWRQLWQAFIGIGARRVKGYYEGLLAADGEKGDSKCSDSPPRECDNGKPKASQPFSSEKWKGQIEKVCGSL